jgi:hypothetical protein
MSQLPSENKEFIKIGKRDIHSPNHWIEEEDAPFSQAVLSGRKVILCLPGDMTLQPRNANHIAKNIRYILTEENRKKVDVYAAYYGNVKDGQRFRVAMAAEYEELSLLLKKQNRPFPLTVQPLYQSFFEKNILPLISKNDGKERLSTEQASQNLRNIIFFTHCHGSLVALDIENRLINAMANLNYSKQEIEQIIGRLLVINANSRMPMNRTKATVVHMISQADTNNNASNTTLTSLHSFVCSEKIKDLYTLAILRLSERENLVLFPQVADPVAVMKGVFGVPRDDIDHCGILFHKQDELFKTYPGNWGCNAVYDILNKAVENDEDPKTIVDTVFQKNFNLKEALSFGDAFLAKYKKEYLKGLQEKITFLKHNPDSLSTTDVPPELLLIPQNGQTVLDTILAHGTEKDLDAAAKILDAKSDALANENILSALVEQGRYEDARLLQKKRRLRTRKANACEIPALFQIPTRDIPNALPFLASCVFNKEEKKDVALLLQLQNKAQRITDTVAKEDACQKIQNIIHKNGIVFSKTDEGQSPDKASPFLLTETKDLKKERTITASLLQTALLNKQTHA